MKNKLIMVFCGVVFLLPFASWAAENAFGSLINVNTNSGSSYPSSNVDKTLHPLFQSPVTSNILMGVMIAPSKKIALVRTATGDEYFLKIGDKLGDAGGSVTGMSINSIDVTEGEKVVTLSVRNRSIADENES